MPLQIILRYGQTDVLYQAHLNDVQERQKFSGYGRRRGARDRMMMENPNLIRRPIMIKGSKVIFGFDKDRYAKL
jgi:hypothetical protein